MKRSSQLGSLLFSAVWLHIALCIGTNMTKSTRQKWNNKTVGRMLRSVDNWPGIPISCFSCNILYGTAGHYPASFEDAQNACVGYRGPCTQKSDCCWDATECKRGRCVGCLQIGEDFHERRDTLGCQTTGNCCGAAVCGNGKDFTKGVCYNPPPRCTVIGGGCTFTNGCCPEYICKPTLNGGPRSPKLSCQMP